jgi:hypothetical protein
MQHLRPDQIEIPSHDSSIFRQFQVDSVTKKSKVSTACHLSQNNVTSNKT